MLETERLILRPFQESDAEDVLEYLKEPEVNSSSDDSETVLPMLSEAPCKTIHIVILPNEKKPATKSSTLAVKANQGFEHEENSDFLKKWFRLLKRSKS